MYSYYDLLDYSYEEDKLLNNTDYIKIKDLLKSKNSHELVEEFLDRN